MKNKPLSKPPIIAEWLLSLCLPNTIKNEILGDLAEEFNQKIAKSANHQMVKQKYWQQALTTSIQYAIIHGKNSLIDANSQQKIMLLIGTIFFISIYLLITWLSNINSTEGINFDIFTELQNGNVHKILTQTGFWPLATTSMYEIKGLSYLFQFEALVWTFISVKILAFCRQKNTISKATFFIFSLLWLFIPYVFGAIYLKLTLLPIQQVGPIVAIMLFSILYLILPITYMNVKNLSTHLNVETHS